MSIALLMMIKDEFTDTKNIINSVGDVCKEKIIVVTGNKKVKESGECKILYFPWHDDYSTPLNAGLRLCESKWVLRLDYDEDIDKVNLRRVVKAVNLKGDVDAFEVNQRGYLPKDRNEFGVKKVPKYNGYTRAVDDRCIRLFKNDPRIFFEFNTHETLYNSLERSKLVYKKTNIVIHHWGKLTMSEKAPYYYKIALERLKRFPDDYQSYYYVGVAADFIGKLDVAYEAFKKGYEKYKTEYYRIPMEFIKRKRRVIDGRIN